MTDISTTCAVAVFRDKMLTLKLRKARTGVGEPQSNPTPSPTHFLNKMKNYRLKNAIITVNDTVEMCFQNLLSDFLQSHFSLACEQSRVRVRG